MTSVDTFEDQDQEIERMQARAEHADADSLDAWIAHAPITNWRAHAGQIVELSRIAETSNGEHRVIGILTSSPIRDNEERNAHGAIINNYGFEFQALASTHPSYPEGGPSCDLTTEEARRCRVITPEQLLSL